MEDMRHLERVIDIMETFNTNVSEGFESAQEYPSCLTCIQGFSEYRDHSWSTVGQLAEYWVSYVDMVGALLALIHPSREGNSLRHCIWHSSEILFPGYLHMTS